MRRRKDSPFCLSCCFLTCTQQTSTSCSYDADKLRYPVPVSSMVMKPPQKESCVGRLKIPHHLFSKNVEWRAQWKFRAIWKQVVGGHYLQRSFAKWKVTVKCGMYAPSDTISISVTDAWFSMVKDFQNVHKSIVSEITVWPRRCIFEDRVGTTAILTWKFEIITPPYHLRGII